MRTPVADLDFPAVIDLVDGRFSLPDKHAVDKVVVGADSSQIRADKAFVDGKIVVVPGFEAADGGDGALRAVCS